MYSLVCTRFNQKTWEENQNYRNKFNFKGCIYGVQHTISPKILLDSYVFVVEMNNSTNNIEGIGFIKNKANLDRVHRIYDDPNYNRFIYKGNFYINRKDLLIYDENMVKIFDYILFKEKTHLKRGSGFVTIPDKLLKHNICENRDIKSDIKHLFKRVFTIMNNDLDLISFEKIAKPILIIEE